MTAENPILAAALRYAARGWPVFPCSARDKRPLLPRDIDPATGKAIPKTGGLVKASCDPETIKGWWRRWPEALIGVSVGVGGLIAIDFDPRTDPDTKEVFTLDRLKAELEAQIGEALPKTITAVTPSGGVHVYFAMPAEPIGNRGNLPEHVDVRGLGGYTIMPPGQISADAPKSPGGRYRWRYSPDSHEVAALPAALEAVLRERGPVRQVAERPPADEVSDVEQPAAAPRRKVAPSGDPVADAVRAYGLKALDAEVAQLAATPQGGRNNAINAAAFALGQLVGAGAISEAEARGGLQGVVRAWPEVEKSEGTIESGLLAGQGSPRDLGEIRAEAAARAERYSGQSRGRAGNARTAAARAADAPASGLSSDVSSSTPPPHPHGEAGSQKSSQMGGSGEGGHSGGAGGRPKGEDLERACSYLPLTDLGNAERWELRHGDDFRYCDELGWLAWDGRRWSKDDAERLLQESIFGTVRGIGGEADWLEAAGEAYRAAHGGANSNTYVEADDPDPFVKRPQNVSQWKRRSEVHRAWGRASEAARAIGAIRTLGQTMVTARLDAFDADIWKLNVKNGTLVIDRGQLLDIEGQDIRMPSVTLQPHDRADLITMLAPVDYVPGADAPLYDKFLERVQPDAEVRRFLHAWGGYNLTGDATEQKFVINHGAKGANGKSTWIDALASLLGDYAIAVNIATFMDEKARSGSSPSPDLAELPHKRLVRTSEPPKGVPFAEALVKLVTGGEPLPARQLNKPFFRYLPEFKITVSMNPVPQLSDDEAIWRRTRVVPWDVSIPPAERDMALPVKLRAEASGILWRLIEGLLDWCAGGLPNVAAVQAATQQIRDTLDPLGRFLAAACEVDAGARVNSTELYRVYQAWAQWAGEKDWSQNGFSRALANRGFEKHQSSVIYFLGLRLVRGRDDFVNPETGQPWREMGDGRGGASDLGG